MMQPEATLKSVVHAAAPGRMKPEIHVDICAVDVLGLLVSCSHAVVVSGLYSHLRTIQPLRAMSCWC